jgi:phage tail tape-measure protein
MITPVINAFATVIKIIATQFEKLHGGIQLMILGVVAVVAALKLMAAQTAAKNAADSLGGGGGGGGGKTGGGLKGAMGSASKFAKLGGAAGALIGGASLYNSFGDINDKVKAGKMSEEEASREKTGAVGEVGGGMAGGIAGAAAGAAIGSVVPVIGTIIGGLIGGALGSYGGSSLGKSAADALTGQKKAADGLMVNTPTSILAGEAGPEIVAPTRHFENLQNELQTLNKQTAEMLRYLKETAESTRNSNNSIKNLGGDLFKF